MAELARLLEPSPDFVKLAVQNFEDRNLTAAVLAEWKPILGSAIHEWAKQQMLTMALDRAGDRLAGDRAPLSRPEATHAPAKQNGPTETREMLRASPEGEREAGAAARKAWETRRVSLKELIDAGVLKAPLKLIANSRGRISKRSSWRTMGQSHSTASRMPLPRQPELRRRVGKRMVGSSGIGTVTDRAYRSMRPGRNIWPGARVEFPRRHEPGERNPAVPYLLNVCYLLLILAALPWLLVQAVRKGKYREGYAAKFLGLVPKRTSDRTCVWLHAVSVGEVGLLAPLLRMIARERPDWECVISTTTMTGMALAKKKYPGLCVFYCPLDFTWAVQRAMRRIRPDLLVLAELELWPNLVRAARRNGARVAVINGRLSEHSFAGYRRIRPLTAALLRQIDLLAVQDAAYAERFLALGADPRSLFVTGSMKYDGAATDRRNPATLRLAAMAGFGADDLVLLAGSTQEPEEAVALDVFRRLQPAWPALRLVLVPRHPERFALVARELDAAGVAWQRRTDLDRSGPDPAARILLVTWWANWAPGGARPGSPSWAGAWAIAAGRT